MHIHPHIHHRHLGFVRLRVRRHTAAVAAVLLLGALVPGRIDADSDDDNGPAPLGDDAPGFSFRVERFDNNPIIHRDLPGLEGDVGRNINGPSLILAPPWLEEPLGKYYLYFAHHHGRFILKRKMGS